MIRLGILGSTRGTSMQAIMTAIDKKKLAAKIAVVLSNREDALILDKAQQHQIPAFFIDPTGLQREQYDQLLTAKLHAFEVDYVLLIGYMRILSAPFIADWPHKIMNVHPSLLPAFANKMDKAVHQAVLNAGLSETGCTVHEVTENVDSGPIILQKKCAVFRDDTVETLKARVQELEGAALIEAVGWALAQQNITPE